MIRKSICAGTWYPLQRRDIESYVNVNAKKRNALAAVCPHAGWVYSGKTAGEVFSLLKPASTFVLIGPNHRGTGSPVGLYPEGEWETPLGNLEVDKTVTDAIIHNSKFAKRDASSHAQEHSIEVQLPFVKMNNPSARIVPIALGDYRPQVLSDLGNAIYQALSNVKGALIVASSDMSHYVSAETAKTLDMLAIEKVLNLDPEGLLETVDSMSISMCGAGPVAAAIIASKMLGAKKAELIRYTNSGAVTGDNEEVVGYAGILIS
ncbi:MAG: AmmeMemoRadiSam system protein B [Endomicrobiales bacterium]|nr:AmmeMemoRadiSam system protein B [Endomicrobiales bacterium]